MPLLILVSLLVANHSDPDSCLDSEGCMPGNICVGRQMMPPGDAGVDAGAVNIRGRCVPQVDTPEDVTARRTTTTESLTNLELVETLSNTSPLLNRCVSLQKAEEPDLAGKTMVVRWAVRRNGSVKDFKVIAKEFRGKRFVRCVREVFEKTKFPRHEKPRADLEFPIKL